MEVILIVEVFFNDICSNVILIKLSHNQPCLIAMIFAGVDILKKNNRNSDFEFHGRLGKATGK